MTNTLLAPLACLALGACAASPTSSPAPAAPAAAKPALPALAGDWWGTLDAGGQKLRLVASFADDGEGGYEGVVVSLDQGGAEIALDEVTLSANSLAFTVPQVAGSYRGIWQDGQWVGTWMQGAMLPLTLVRGRPEVEESAIVVPDQWTLPGDPAVAARLAALTEADGVVGAVALVEDGAVRTLLSEGADPEARFEIGSVTKVFTAMLLADLVLDGTLSLDDTLGEHIDGINNAQVRGITLRQLSNHRSGLPRLPANLLPMAALPDPYARYGEAMLLDWIRTVDPVRAPREGYEYSNAAVGLLGWLVGKAAGSDYKTAMVERITGPMGLAETDFTARRAIGGFAGGNEVSLWTFDSLAGAGALRSTIADLARFASVLAEPPERWARHVDLLSSNPVEASGGMTIGLGLFTIPVTKGGVRFHNGGTGGFKTTLWADPETKRAAVANVNSAEAALDPFGAWMIAGVER